MIAAELVENGIRVAVVEVVEVWVLVAAAEMVVGGVLVVAAGMGQDGVPVVATKVSEVETEVADAEKVVMLPSDDPAAAAAKIAQDEVEVALVNVSEAEIQADAEKATEEELWVAAATVALGGVLMSVARLDQSEAPIVALELDSRVALADAAAASRCGAVVAAPSASEHFRPSHRNQHFLVKRKAEVGRAGLQSAATAKPVPANK